MRADCGLHSARSVWTGPLRPVDISALLCWLVIQGRNLECLTFRLFLCLTGHCFLCFQPRWPFSLRDPVSIRLAPHPRMRAVLSHHTSCFSLFPPFPGGPGAARPSLPSPFHHHCSTAALGLSYLNFLFL